MLSSGVSLRYEIQMYKCARASRMCGPINSRSVENHSDSFILRMRSVRSAFTSVSCKSAYSLRIVNSTRLNRNNIPRGRCFS